MSTTNTAVDDPSEDQILTHFIYRRIQENGGPVPLDDIAMSASSVGDFSQNDVVTMVSNAHGNYCSTIRGDSGEILITSVNPVGQEPSVVTSRFGETDSTASNFIAIDAVTRDVDAILSAEFGGFEELSEADPDQLTDLVNDELDARAEPTDFEEINRLTDSEVTALQSSGITTYRDFVQADPSDVAASGSSTLTEAKVARAQETVEGQVATFTPTDARRVVDGAQQFIPAGKHLGREALGTHSARVDAVGEAAARVSEVEEETDSVGEPLALVRDDLDESSEEAFYTSDIGHNADSPVRTGLPILEDTGYEKVPKLATDPDAGHSALPVDENGDVVPPTVPLERDLQMPLDEFVAQKLAQNAPVRIVGPRGSGKNYLLKYLAYKTNRGYRSLDVDKATMPQDLFGPISPNRNGVLEPKNGEVKQGLLNGDLVVINEFPVMSAGAAMSMHQLLNENKIVIKSHGQEIDPHPQARIVITMNPPTREYRDSQPMNSATRGRFHTAWMGYPETVEAEVETLDQQFNSQRTVVDRDTLERVVEFAHRTRRDNMGNWPTLSTRNLTIVCDHIKIGASPAAAVKNVLRNVAEPNQSPEDAFEAIGDLF